MLSLAASVLLRWCLPLFMRLRKRVNAAFQFGSTPPAGTGIGARNGNRGTWLAADAEISRLIQRQRLNGVLHGILLNLPPIPQGQRVHLEQRFIIRELMLLNYFEIFARGRLLATQSGEPDVIRPQGTKQRLHFAQMAALSRINAVQDAELRFLVSHGLQR